MTKDLSQIIIKPSDTDLENKERWTSLGLPENYDWSNHRAYIGPPGEYDLFSAMVFNLLTTIGLRQHHRVLDIGCGSLRIGRLLMPYLNIGNYYAIEPNKWLVDEGIKNEIGNDLIQIKKPTFSFNTTMEDFKEPLNLDYAVAQSIFSHCGMDLLQAWLSQVSYHLKDDGALVATFLVDDKDYDGNGWIYPGCVKYTLATLSNIADQYGFSFDILDWTHPRQTWGVFAKKNYDHSLIQGGNITWNRLLAHTMKKSQIPL